MEASYRFFENKDCKYFPCHQGMEGADFNCLFCYCPMNPYADCLGNPTYITNQTPLYVTREAAQANLSFARGVLDDNVLLQRSKGDILLPIIQPADRWRFCRIAEK